MTNAVRLPVRQGTPEWIEARRGLVSSTDVPVLLGLSPYKSEGQLAREKLGAAAPSGSTPAMRAGSYMEAFVADEYAAATGRRVRRIRNLLRHPSIEWAVASIDREAVGERRLIEIKTTAGKRFEDEIPQDTEAQVRWALGVSGYKVADIAVWVYGAREPLRIEQIEHDDDTFEGLLSIAADFRRRLAEGGPFAESLESLKARYPRDDGSTTVADAETAEAVRELLVVRASIAGLEIDEERLKVAIQTRMGDTAVLDGDGFRVVWRRTKETTTTDWRAVADAALRQLPEPERVALVGTHSTVREGFRPFRVSKEKP